MKGTMNHARASFSTEMFAGAMISVVQYVAPLLYALGVLGATCPKRLDSVVVVAVRAVMYTCLPRTAVLPLFCAS
jgi:hypothetical protein